MDFDLQTTLQGELIELRPLRADDFNELYRVASDPLIWEQHPDSDRCQQEVFRKFFDVALESGGALVAIDRRDSQIIGSSRSHSYNREASEIVIGFTFLGRSHWGGAYNGEMKRLMLAHAFKFVANVIFLVNSKNIRSRRAVEKIGGQRVGSKLDPVGRETVIYRIRNVKSSHDQDEDEIG